MAYGHHLEIINKLQAVSMEIPINFLEAIPQISSSVATNVVKLPSQKMADKCVEEYATS